MRFSTAGVRPEGGSTSAPPAKARSLHDRAIRTREPSAVLAGARPAWNGEELDESSGRRRRGTSPVTAPVRSHAANGIHGTNEVGHVVIRNRVADGDDDRAERFRIQQQLGERRNHRATIQTGDVRHRHRRIVAAPASSRIAADTSAAGIPACSATTPQNAAATACPPMNVSCDIASPRARTQVGRKSCTVELSCTRIVSHAMPAPTSASMTSAAFGASAATASAVA
jgi:hypothetical protein